MEIPPLTLLRLLCAPHAGVVVRGTDMPFAEVNGTMIAFISSEHELCLRFDEALRADFAKRYGCDPVLQNGVVMMGYVAIPVEELGAEDAVEDLFAECVAFGRAFQYRAKPPV